jgi:hypothetical protein
MSLTFVRATDAQRVANALAEYYASAERPGPVEAADEAARSLKAWEDGFEPAPEARLELSVSPARNGWIAVIFPFPLTFDAPMTAWLASTLGTEALAAFTWGDGFGLVAFDPSGVAWSQGHIREERSDLRLSRRLRSEGVPFDGNEDRTDPSAGDGDERSGWRKVTAPPRPWPPLAAARPEDRE